jgi:hypothetical protein
VDNKQMQKYSDILDQLANEHPELQDEIENLQVSMFDLSEPDVAADKEEAAEPAIEIEIEPMPEEEEMEEEEEEVAPAPKAKKKKIPLELMD